ncbi:hypothetical protein EVJ58_g8366, partial [Rhodofomes roseus]
KARKEEKEEHMTSVRRKASEMTEKEDSDKLGNKGPYRQIKRLRVEEQGSDKDVCTTMQVDGEDEVNNEDKDEDEDEDEDGYVPYRIT